MGRTGSIGAWHGPSSWRTPMPFVTGPTSHGNERRATLERPYQAGLGETQPFDEAPEYLAPLFL